MPLALAAIQRPGSGELLAIAPIIAVAAAVVGVLLTPLISSRRSAIQCGAIAVVGLIAGLVLTFFAAQGAAFQSFVVIDTAALFWQRLVTIFVIGTALMAIVRPRSAWAGENAPEFFVLLLSATCGMMLMASTTHLLTLLLAMEIASMPSYVLAGFHKGRRKAAEGALKFALFGAVCTAVTIYGLSLIFAAHHTFDVAAIATQSMTPLAAVGWLFVAVGLLFKISGAPLHFWLPDAFDGADTPVAAFLSVASKGAGVMVLARFAMLLSHQPAAHTISILLAIVAVATTTIGNFAAWRQSDAKRLLAYSSIAHAGYLLSAMALLQPAGLAAMVVYLIAYAVMNLGAFAVLADVEALTGSTAITAFDGLNRRSRLAAAAMAICLFSMIGLPPAVGFMGKLKILAALGAGGGAWWIVAASVAINSIVSMAVYARILRPMYLSPPADQRLLPAIATWLGAVCAVLLIAMLIFFAPLDRWAEEVAKIFG